MELNYYFSYGSSSFIPLKAEDLYESNRGVLLGSHLLGIKELLLGEPFIEDKVESDIAFTLSYLKESIDKIRSDLSEQRSLSHIEAFTCAFKSLLKQLEKSIFLEKPTLSGKKDKDRLLKMYISLKKFVSFDVDIKNFKIKRLYDLKYRPFILDLCAKKIII
ncbi:hypothetical protein AB834_01975 [PVC group bacterium (ex Bugula neritina AB1)]|nr:hypothetical protein AB834_01975 [PVC group bacterium (ex Bugula neritina AB1)]